MDESDLHMASWSALPLDEESFFEESVRLLPPCDHDMRLQLGSKDLVFISLHFSEIV